MATEPLEFRAFVRAVIDALELVGIEYMVGGGVALIPWGEGRSTLDVDLVVSLHEDQLVPLYEELLKRGMMVPPDIMLSLIRDTQSDLAINAIHGFSGFKAEMFPLREGDELRQSALQRRRQADLGPPIGRVYVHSPEDLILYKLLYYSISYQTKHLRDIHSIFPRVLDLDTSYIEYWADQKGLLNVWKEIRSKAP